MFGKLRSDTGEPEAAEPLPDVDRPEPVVAMARVGMRDLVDFQAAPPLREWGAMPTSGGDMGGSGGADGVADGVADGRMPKAYKRRPAGRRDRTRPMAEPMMLRQTPGYRAVTDSNSPGTPEGSLVLPQMRR